MCRLHSHAQEKSFFCGSLNEVLVEFVHEPFRPAGYLRQTLYWGTESSLFPRERCFKMEENGVQLSETLCYGAMEMTLKIIPQNANLWPHISILWSQMNSIVHKFSILLAQIRIF